MKGILSIFGVSLILSGTAIWPSTILLAAPGPDDRISPDEGPYFNFLSDSRKLHLLGVFTRLTFTGSNPDENGTAYAPSSFREGAYLGSVSENRNTFSRDELVFPIGVSRNSWDLKLGARTYIQPRVLPLRHTLRVDLGSGIGVVGQVTFDGGRTLAEETAWARQNSGLDSVSYFYYAAPEDGSALPKFADSPGLHFLSVGYDQGDLIVRIKVDPSQKGPWQANSMGYHVIRTPFCSLAECLSNSGYFEVVVNRGDSVYTIEALRYNRAVDRATARRVKMDIPAAFFPKNHRFHIASVVGDQTIYGAPGAQAHVGGYAVYAQINVSDKNFHHQEDSEAFSEDRPLAAAALPLGGSNFAFAPEHGSLAFGLEDPSARPLSGQRFFVACDEAKLLVRARQATDLAAYEKFGLKSGAGKFRFAANVIKSNQRLAPLTADAPVGSFKEQKTYAGQCNSFSTGSLYLDPRRDNILITVYYGINEGLQVPVSSYLFSANLLANFGQDLSIRLGNQDAKKYKVVRNFDFNSDYGSILQLGSYIKLPHLIPLAQ